MKYKIKIEFQTFQNLKSQPKDKENEQIQSFSESSKLTLG